MIQCNHQSRHDFTNRSESRIRTDVTDAIMTGADLRGVDLRGVRGLTRHQIRSARVDSTTQLSTRLRLLCALDRFAGQFIRRNGSAARYDR